MQKEVTEGENVTKVNFKNLNLLYSFYEILDITLQIEGELCG